VLGHLDEGRRKLAVVVGEQRRRHRVGRVTVRSEVHPAVGGHLILGEEQRVGGRLGRPVVRGHVGAGVAESLMADRKPAPVAGEQADHGGQGAAGALPHHAQRPFGAKFSGIGGRPDHGRVAVLDGGGEPVHRREPVVHRDDHGADSRGDLAANPVPQAQTAAKDESAAVEVDHQRPGAGRGGRGGRRGIHPDREISARSGNRPVGQHDPRCGFAEDQADHAALRDLPVLRGDHLGVAACRDRGLTAGHRSPDTQPQIHWCHRTLLMQDPRGGRP
jgi:hypothetical protein